MEQRQQFISSKKKGQEVSYFKEDNIDAEKWQIELVDDSSKTHHEKFIGKDEREESKLEDLMNLMNKL